MKSSTLTISYYWFILDNVLTNKYQMNFIKKCKQTSAIILNTSHAYNAYYNKYIKKSKKYA